MSEPRSVVQQLFGRLGGGDLDGVMALFAEDAVFVDCVGPTVIEGRPAIGEALSELWAGLHDFRVDKVIHAVGEGDLLFSEVEVAGTHAGEYLGVPPTGREVRWAAVYIHELTPDRQIARETFYYDSQGVLDQLRSGG